MSTAPDVTGCRFHAPRYTPGWSRPHGGYPAGRRCGTIGGRTTQADNPPTTGAEVDHRVRAPRSGQNSKHRNRTRSGSGDPRRRGVVSARHRPRGDVGVAGVVRRAAGALRAGAGALPDVAAAGTRRRTAGGDPGADVDRLRQHHPDRTGAVVPRRRGRRAPLPGVDPMERGHHGAPRAAPGSRCRRPHLDLRVVGGAVRGRLQPLLPRQVASRRRRPGVHPGPRLPRHLRARLPGGPAQRRPARRLPPGAQPPRRRAAVLPAPAADARLLGVPDGVDGPRPDERDLPGPVQPLPARPGHQGHLRPARVGVPRRRRDGRAGEPRAGARRRRSRAWTT